MSVLICLDPGHVRGFNRGAYDQYFEGTKMYDLAVMLKEEIEKYDGIEAMITRSNVDEDPSLSERGARAKRAGACCLLSLHTNACATPSVIRTVIYRSVAMPKSEALGLKLMSAIVKTIKENGGTAAEDAAGILTRYNSVGTDYYGILRGSTGGSVKESLIIEHVFHTNYDQARWMNDDNHLRAIAVAEAAVLAEHYAAERANGGQTTAPSTQNPTNTDKPYTTCTVQYGDSWWGLAAIYLGSGLKMSELAKYNNKTIFSQLHPGDVIKIPKSSDNTTTQTPPTETKSEYVEYTVKAGDSWWGIARNELGSGLKYKSLAEYNGKTANTPIHPGEVIKIPKN